MRREGEGWRLYRGEYPGRPRGGATGPPAALVGRAHWSPEGGRQAPPVARPPFFFSRDFVANLEKKKLHFGSVALWEGDRGIFLKFSKTDIYF